jgi:hypothetical protein
MNDFAARHKPPRSRSGRVKIDGEPSILHLSRRKPIFVPKSISFVRGTAPRTQQALLADNVWICLTESLSQLITHEGRMINEFHASHAIPPPPSSSVEAFLSEFERRTVNLDDPMQCERIRAFCSSFANIFAAHVAWNLLYEAEMNYTEVIKQNPLKNSPAIFVLRFLYYLPSLFKTEPIDTPSALNMQANFKLLIDFAHEKRDRFFTLPKQVHTHPPPPPRPALPVKSESASRVVLILNKS